MSQATEFDEDFWSKYNVIIVQLQQGIADVSWDFIEAHRLTIAQYR